LLDPDVRLGCFQSPKDLPGLVVRDPNRDDDIIALLPVDRGRDLVPGRQLPRVRHAQDFVEVAVGGHGVDKGQLDLLSKPMTKPRTRSDRAEASATARRPLSQGYPLHPIGGRSG
jgi:hypothetical protein